MTVPNLADLRTWDGTAFNQNDWDYNMTVLVNYLSNSLSDLEVNSVTAENGFDASNARIKNVLPAVDGTDAVNYDQVQTILNQNSVYVPFTVASGKVNASGLSAYIQKDSDTQITLLAGATNPDLTLVLSDGTIETLTSNVVLTVGGADDTYYIIKPKGESTVLSSANLSIGAVFPSTPVDGDYFLDISTTPFVGYKYASVGGWSNVEFGYLGYVVKSSGTATVTTLPYNPTVSFTNYKNPISKTWNTSYTADVDGWIFVSSVTTTTVFSTLTINSLVVWNNSGSSAGDLNTGFIPIAKGSTYIATGGASSQVIKFIPAKGV